MELRELTKAEEQIMQVLWELKKGFVKDVIDQLPEPKPAYNTVSTIIRILEKKGLLVIMLMVKRMSTIRSLIKKNIKTSPPAN